MNTALTIVVALLVFGFLIFIHEFGHYIFARIFKVKINEYYDLVAVSGNGCPIDIDKWYKWQRECVRKGISAEGFEMTLNSRASAMVLSNFNTTIAISDENFNKLARNFVDNFFHKYPLYKYKNFFVKKIACNIINL